MEYVIGSLAIDENAPCRLQEKRRGKYVGGFYSSLEKKM
jgi:hypothetical protein